jgi:hypothetical protein
MATVRSTVRPTRTRSSTARTRSSTARRRPRSGRAPSRRPSKKRSRRSLGTLVPTWWPVALLVAAALIGVAWNAGDEAAAPTPAPDGACTLPGSGVTVTEEQVGNAAIIAQVGRDRGLPDRAVVIALATAQQESRLRNLDYGDRDSLGLFQQRPSQGWGTEAQVQDPVYAAGKFYDWLVTVPGWETGRLTEVAQAVQRSGYPELYQQHEAMAVELTASLAPGATPPCS